MSYRLSGRALGQTRTIYASGRPPTALEEAAPVLLVGGAVLALGGLFWLTSWKRRKLKEGLGEERGELASMGLGLLTGI